MDSEPAAEGALDALRRLEQTVADLRAETGAEAMELRARVRAVENRVEELAKRLLPGEVPTARPSRKPREPHGK